MTGWLPRGLAVRIAVGVVLVRDVLRKDGIFAVLAGGIRRPLAVAVSGAFRGITNHVFCLLAGRAKQQLAEAGQRGILVADHRKQLGVRVKHLTNQGGVFRPKCVGFNSVDEFFQLLGVHFDNLRRVGLRAFALHDNVDRGEEECQLGGSWGADPSWPASYQGSGGQRKTSWESFAGRGSCFRSYAPPLRRGGCPIGVAGRQEHQQLVCGQGRGATFGRRGGPPAEASLRETFLAEPESLAIVNQCLDGRGPSVAKHEDASLKRIVL